MDHTAPTVKSPCCGVCFIDPATGWCAGCCRTGDEIAAWPSLNDEQRRTLIATLEARNGGPLP
ncbi:MAG: DUF1289 domain-containing protein [Rhodobiaceae bacterium]|nr:DUF1289 domain-containing protein [Rhodobiaceae bacterium]MCC0057557.1 DUF1289 domain-containing protein [Rhodobiaceae bacterium]